MQLIKGGSIRPPFDGKKQSNYARSDLIIKIKAILHNKQSLYVDIPFKTDDAIFGDIFGNPFQIKIRHR